MPAQSARCHGDGGWRHSSLALCAWLLPPLKPPLTATMRRRKPAPAVMEKQIDFVMGSGNHARAYLNRTVRNALVELPLAWYAENGGYWSMNPGYDLPDHEGFRRKIAYDCMFCHNGYPKIPAGHDRPFAESVYLDPLPEGIDCQRCHGPGRKHAELAKTARAKPDEIRKAIVNPARLSADRREEV